MAFFMKDSPSWILPVITAIVIDTVVANGPFTSLLILGLIAILVLAQNYPMNMIYVKRSSRATRSIAFELRTTLTEHLQKVTINFHQRVSRSVIQTKIVRDVENIELMIQQSLPIALSGIFSLIGALIVLALNVPLFLLVFAMVIPLGVGLVIIFRRKSRIQNEAFRSQVEQFSTQVGELSSMLPVVRAHAIETTAKQWVNESADQLRKKGVQLDWLNGRFGALAWLSYQVLGVLSLIFAASVAVLNIIPITPGQVVLVATYFGVMMGTAIGLLNVLPSLAKGIESVHSIEELLASDELEKNEGKARVGGISGALTIKDLTVELGNKPVLDAISLEIPAKSTFAFVGPSGSGKTTLLHAILGLARPSAGEIYFDSQPMSHVDMRSIRSHLAYVPQESVILDGSLRDNVALGLLADDEKIEQALAQANLSEFMKGEGGLNQVIGRSGTRLSVGQRQRLAIARALYREPKILFLDEATSALDMESERFIQKTLADLAHQVTIIVVAHRLSTVQGADQICYLEAGRIFETGTHEQLMNKKGPYHQMVVGKEMN
jgi:ATP-binding cassette subfamily B protein